MSLHFLTLTVSPSSIIICTTSSLIAFTQLSQWFNSRWISSVIQSSSLSNRDVSGSECSLSLFFAASFSLSKRSDFNLYRRVMQSFSSSFPASSSFSLVITDVSKRYQFCVQQIYHFQHQQRLNLFVLRLSFHFTSHRSDTL